MRASTIAYIIQVVSYIILPKLYSPEQFGYYGTFTSIATILFAFSTGRYERAILLPEKEEDAKYLVILPFYLSSVVTLLALIIIVCFNDSILVLINLEKTHYLIYLIPLYSFILSIVEIITFYLNRNSSYKQIANIKITYSSVSLFISILFGLINGEIFGRIISVIIYFKKSVGLAIRKLSLKVMFNTAKEYKDFPTKSAPAALLGVLSNNISLIAIGTIFGAGVLGKYLIAYKILSIPVAVIGKSISQVYYRQIIDLKKQIKLNKLVRITSISLFGIICVIIFVLILISKSVIPFVYGQQWLSTYTYIKILAPFFIINFVYTCQSTLLYVYKKQKYELTLNGLSLLLQLVVFSITYYSSLSFITTLIGISVSLSLVNILALIFIFRIVRIV